MSQKLTADMIKVGSPIPWDLENNEGKIVFRQGFVINTEASLQRLLKMELICRKSVEAAVEEDANGESGADSGLQHAVANRALSDTGTLNQIDRIADRINECFTGICQGPRPPLSDLEGIISDTRSLYRDSTETCIAAIHFNHHRSYGSLHPIYSLFLAELVGDLMTNNNEVRATLSCAALTANLGMYRYHDQWAHQETRLSDEHNRIRLEHPKRSVKCLKDIGVEDNAWMEAIIQHHEMQDGSGYPAGIAGTAIRKEAAVLSIIDRYLAFVMPRGSRGFTHPTVALRKIFEDSGKYDKKLVSILIKQLGVYPPGTALMLANGEIAVVTRRNFKNTLLPEIISVARKQGDYLSKPLQRDASKPEYKIKDVYVFQHGKENNPALRVGKWE